MPRSIQINESGELVHLLTTEGIPKALMLRILDRANAFLDPKNPKEVVNAPLLDGKSVFNLFFENS
ncbi:MAG: Aspartate carbamoyltransferase, partial [Pseudomonadota bacterium]